jgi:hypothetical protein
MNETKFVDYLNKYLRFSFGIDTGTNQPMFRVVFSDDQFEKRMTEFTDSGIQLLNPEVREQPKYKTIGIQGKWILERLVVVPEINIKELAGAKLSYEPLWVFQDKDGFPLPPKLEACKLIIDTLYAALGKQSMAKYVDELAKNPKEERDKRINNLQSELFGNETAVGDALAHGYGISQTGPTFKEVN